MEAPWKRWTAAVGSSGSAHPHAMWNYDHIPKGDVEIRRASPVRSADGHHLGHVDGFLIDGPDHIGHLVLEHGHLRGKREVVIPIGAVARVETDEIVLALSKDEVGALESHRVHRWRNQARPVAKARPPLSRSGWRGR